jgi:hypothetical protein
LILLLSKAPARPRSAIRAGVGSQVGVEQLALEPALDALEAVAELLGLALEPAA